MVPVRREIQLEKKLHRATQRLVQGPIFHYGMMGAIGIAAIGMINMVVSVLSYAMKG